MVFDKIGMGRDVLNMIADDIFSYPAASRSHRVRASVTLCSFAYIFYETIFFKLHVSFRPDLYVTYLCNGLKSSKVLKCTILRDVCAES